MRYLKFITALTADASNEAPATGRTAMELRDNMPR